MIMILSFCRAWVFALAPHLFMKFSHGRYLPASSQARGDRGLLGLN
jgi:hypothetical protein